MKKILLNFPTQTFINHSIRIINRLSKKNKIVILLNDYYIQPNHNKLIRNLIKQNKITAYYKIPENKSFLSYTELKYIKSIEKKLKSYNFDYYITALNTTIYSKYICDSILKKKCKKILFIFGIPEILRYQNIRQINNYKNLKKEYSFYKQCKYKFLSFFYSENKKKILKILSFFRLIYNYFKNKINNLLNFFIIPLLMVGKIYRSSYLENKIKIYPNKIDLIIVGNQLEKKIFKKFITNNKIEIARLSENNCNCKIKKKKYPNGLLSCLSWPLFHENLSEDFYKAYIRDFKIIIKKMKIDLIHLRPHPEQLNRWEEKLKEELIKLGVKVKIIGRSKSKYGLTESLDKIVCNYKVVAGFSSGAIREAIEYCNKLNVIVFEKVSGFEINRSEKAKNFYKHIDRIGWINYNGSYKNNLFKIKEVKYKGSTLSDFVK